MKKFIIQSQEGIERKIELKKIVFLIKKGESVEVYYPKENGSAIITKDINKKIIIRTPAVYEKEKM